ncbi:DUF998 domain-containing protein [Kitasatospora camelliae]|uniref:DUF998 domain-containing protein n=1 Tax=Kitasatospora camelliae TaxID=3156397 RepID=A0AAU8K0N1_9ACTN
MTALPHPTATTATTAQAATTHTTAQAAPHTAGTRTLLTAGALAGPLFAALALGQAATREGFDLTRHPLSALSTGSLGWLQIANFLLSGALFTAGAVGLRRSLRGTPGGTWAPRLLLASGLGTIAAGLFTMDPAGGFPAGTPDGAPQTLSWHAAAHLAAGSLAFTALIAACYVLGRHYRRTGDRRRALLSRVAGTALLLGNGWAMGGGPAGTLTLAVGALTAMLWASAAAAHHRRTA